MMHICLKPVISIIIAHFDILCDTLSCMNNFTIPTMYIYMYVLWYINVCVCVSVIRYVHLLSSSVFNAVCVIYKREIVVCVFY